LLLSLSERRVAASTAGLLRLLIDPGRGTAFAIPKRDPGSHPEKRKSLFGKDHAPT
jgi:hypothetical protein